MKGKEWDHVIVLSETANNFQVKCIYCSKVFWGSGNRIRAHMGIETATGVAKCGKVPVEILECFKAADAVKQSEKQENARKRNLDKAVTSTSLSSSSAKQPKLTNLFKNIEKAEVDESIARMMYSTGISFNVVNNKHFREMCSQIGKYGPAYKPPSDHPIRTTLLDKEYAKVQNRVQTSIFTYLNLKMGTIVSDGWSDAQQKPLLNILLVTSSGSTFIESIDTTGNTKDSGYIAQVIMSSIEKIGPELILQVITDSAANCKAAWQIIAKKFPKIVCGPCSAHCLDLLLEDWGKLIWISSILKDVIAVVKFIKGHDGSRAMLKKHSPNKFLLHPAETRFGTCVIMTQRLVELKDALQEMIVSREYKAWLSNKSYKIAGEEVSVSVLSEPFWKKCQLYLDINKPVFELLRLVDGDAPVTGKIYFKMFTIQESINNFPNISQAQRKELYDSFARRWAMMHTTLHAAGFLLDPEYVNMAQHANDEVMTGFYQLVELLHPEVEEQVIITNQLNNFRSSQGIFARPVAKAAASTMPAHQWWHSFGSGVPELQRFAIRVLSQTATSSAAERNWSLFGFFQNKRRSRLNPKTIEKMVYIHANTRLMDKVEEVDYVEENVKWNEPNDDISDTSEDSVQEESDSPDD